MEEYSTALATDSNALFSSTRLGQQMLISIRADELTFLSPVYDRHLRALDKDNSPTNKFRYFGAFNYATKWKSWNFLQRLLTEKIKDINFAITPKGATLLSTIFTQEFFQTVQDPYTPEDLLRLFNMITAHKSCTPTTRHQLLRAGTAHRSMLECAILVKFYAGDKYTGPDAFDIVKDLVEHGVPIEKQTLNMARNPTNKSTKRVLRYLLDSLDDTSPVKIEWLAEHATDGPVLALLAKK